MHFLIDYLTFQNIRLYILKLMNPTLKLIV